MIKQQVHNGKIGINASFENNLFIIATQDDENEVRVVLTEAELIELVDKCNKLLWNIK